MSHEGSARLPSSFARLRRARQGCTSVKQNCSGAMQPCCDPVQYYTSSLQPCVSPAQSYMSRAQPSRSPAQYCAGLEQPCRTLVQACRRRSQRSIATWRVSAGLASNAFGRLRLTEAYCDPERMVGKATSTRQYCWPGASMLTEANVIHRQIWSTGILLCSTDSVGTRLAISGSLPVVVDRLFNRKIK